MLSGEEYLTDTIKKALKAKFKGITFYSEEVAEPAAFPSVTFVEYNNYAVQQMQLGDNVEHYVHVSYQVNAYSNLRDGGKRQCKEIINVVDEIMRAHGFIRRLNSPQENMQRTIHRRVARYSGIIGENGLVYKSSFLVEG